MYQSRCHHDSHVRCFGIELSRGLDIWIIAILYGEEIADEETNESFGGFDPRLCCFVSRTHISSSLKEKRRLMDCEQRKHSNNHPHTLRPHTQRLQRRIPLQHGRRSNLDNSRIRHHSHSRKHRHSTPPPLQPPRSLWHRIHNNRLKTFWQHIQQIGK
jgi:hypothetical protein